MKRRIKDLTDKQKHILLGVGLLLLGAVMMTVGLLFPPPPDL